MTRTMTAIGDGRGELANAARITLGGWLVQIRKMSGGIRIGAPGVEIMIQRTRVGIYGVITRRNISQTIGGDAQAEYMILRRMKMEATDVAGKGGYGLHHEIRTRQASKTTIVTGEKNVGIVHIENGCRPTQTMLEVLTVIRNQEGHEAHQPISTPQAL
jgi:hypothetical protein